MKRNFEFALQEVLKHEGGYVDHPKDPGGATNKGITIATFRRYVKKNGSKADLKKITTDQAGIVYKKRYWDKVQGDYLPSGIDYAVFDFAVNSGPSRAVKFLQRTLNVTPDGKLGPVTLRAAQNSLPSRVVEDLCDTRLSWLKRLRTWKTFGRGWERRVVSVRANALLLSRTAPSKPTLPETPPRFNWIEFIVSLIKRLLKIA